MTIIVGTKVKTKSKGLYGVVTEVLSKKKVIITTDDDGDGGFSHWFSGREWKVSDLKEIDEYPSEIKDRERHRGWWSISDPLINGSKVRRASWFPDEYIQIQEDIEQCGATQTKYLIAKYIHNVGHFGNGHQFEYFLTVDDLKATDWYVVK